MAGKMTRRSLLVSVPALAIATSLPAGPVEARATIVERLLQLFEHPASARSIGRLYLQNMPEEAAVSELLRFLERDLDLKAWLREGGELVALRQRLAERASRDYREGKCLRLCGCYMPVTELRLCALATLSA